jgi:hypothetical protein
MQLIPQDEIKTLAKKWVELYDYSNPDKAQQNLNEWLGDDALLLPSTKSNKKYMIFNPNKNKWVHFGQIPYSDFLKHNDEKRRLHYKARAENIKGNWKDDKYSPNNLSIHVLW